MDFVRILLAGDRGYCWVDRQELFSDLRPKLQNVPSVQSLTPSTCSTVALLICLSLMSIFSYPSHHFLPLSIADPSMAPPGKHALHAYFPATEPYHRWAGLDRKRWQHIFNLDFIGCRLRHATYTGCRVIQ